ncbi:MAG: rhodanese-like domain-containing protein [Candidatus Nanopelagicales bacterium]
MALINRVAAVPAVDGAQARKLVQDGALLLDVREQGEWNEAHAPQAQLLPLGSLTNASSKLPNDQTIVVVCRSGSRSNTAAGYLNTRGYKAVNLAGGLGAWAVAGGELVNGAGQPLTV